MEKMFRQFDRLKSDYLDNSKLLQREVKNLSIEVNSRTSANGNGRMVAQGGLPGAGNFQEIFQKLENLREEFNVDLKDATLAIEGKITRLSKEKNPLKDAQTINTINYKIKKLEQKTGQNKEEISFFSEQIKHFNNSIESLKHERREQIKINNALQEERDNGDDQSELKTFVRKEFMKLKLDVEGLDDRVVITEEKCLNLENTVSILKAVFERNKNNVLLNGFKNRLDKLEESGSKLAIFAELMQRDNFFENISSKLTQKEDQFNTLDKKLNQIEDSLKENEERAEKSKKSQIQLFEKLNMKLDRVAHEATTGVTAAQEVFHRVGDLEKRGVSNSGQNGEAYNPQLEEWFKKEIKGVYNFIEEFINEICLEHLTTLKSTMRTATEKMDSVDWFARNVEFVSPKLFGKLLDTCYDEYKKEKDGKNFFMVEHNSSIMTSLKRLLTQAIKDQNRDAWIKWLPSHLTLTEIALLSEYNRDLAVNKNYADFLLTLTLDEQYTKEVNKIALSCVSLALQDDRAVAGVIQNEKFSKFLAYGMEKEFDDPRNLKSVLMLLQAGFSTEGLPEVLIDENPNIVNLILVSFQKYKDDEELVKSHLKVQIIPFIANYRHLSLLASQEC